jgi:hypothetical protein
MRLARRRFLQLATGAAAFCAFHKAEIEKWWPVIKSAGIKLE